MSKTARMVLRDHLVQDLYGFAMSFELAGNISRSRGEIALIGVEPTFAATGFGYIERGDQLDVASPAYQVRTFKEKPDRATAVKYLQSGRYFWNCGYFVGTIGTFLGEMEQYAPALWASFMKLSTIDSPQSEDYNKTYLTFENQVIDIALIERVESLSVVKAGFDWMDVGSFRDLHGVLPKDETGSYLRGALIHSIDVEDVYIRNDGNRPLAVIGVENLVVVSTEEGILVARKDMSHRAGEVAKLLQA